MDEQTPEPTPEVDPDLQAILAAQKADEEKARAATEKPKRGKAGRPRVSFDLEEVEKLGKIGATAGEIAAYFSCGLRTVRDRLDKKDSEFRAAYEKGFCALKRSLRRKQIEVAQGGNVGMLIWLGKQLLEQRDRRLEEISGLDGAPIKTESTTTTIDQRKPVSQTEEEEIVRRHFERELKAGHAAEKPPEPDAVVPQPDASPTEPAKE